MSKNISSSSVQEMTNEDLLRLYSKISFRMAGAHSASEEYRELDQDLALVNAELLARLSN